MLDYKQDNNMSGELRAAEKTSDSCARNLLANPFKGLDSYSEADADFFFGREDNINQIFDSLQNEPITILHGQSGVGKSSILRAGVLPIFCQDAKQQLQVPKTPKSVAFIFPSDNISSPWKENPTTQLLNQIEAGLKNIIKSDLVAEFNKKQVIQQAKSPLTRSLQKWTKLLGYGERSGEIFIILDQFEEYFLEESSPKDNLIPTLIEILRDPCLPVKLLLAIRSDSLNQIDRHFKGFGHRIDRLINNRIELECLSKDAAREAAIETIRTYNKKLSLTHEKYYRDKKVGYELELIDEILTKVSSKISSEEYIEASYLQLVMKRLWEIDAKSKKLKLETLKNLGGAEGVVEDHLREQFNRLSNQEQDIATQIFYYLVTPSGAKIAHTVDDLVGYANDKLTEAQAPLKSEEVKSLLDKLSQGDARILRRLTGDRYEIFFPVLATGVLNLVQLQRQIESLAQEANIALQQFHLSQLKALRTVMKAAKWLSKVIKQDEHLAGNVSSVKIIETLQTILNDIQEKKEFKPPEGSVYSVNFSSDGLQLAIGASDGTIQLWDLQKKQLKQLNKLDSPVYYVCFSPDGKNLAAAKGLGTICLWDIQNHQQINPSFRELIAGSSPFYFLSFSGDSQKLASGSEDGIPYLWDLQSKQQQPAKGEQQNSPIYSVSLSANGQMLATASGNAPLVLWQLEEDKKELKKVTENYKGLSQLKEVLISSVAFSPTEPMKLAAGSSIDGTVYLWNLEDVHGEPIIFPKQEEEEQIAYVNFNPEGNKLATVSLKGRVCLWNLEDIQKNQKPQFTTKTIEDILYRVDFSPDSKQLAIVQWDGIARLWNLQPQKREKVIKKLPGDKVTHITFNPNKNRGKQLAIGYFDGKIQIYDIDRESPPNFLNPDHQGGPVYRLCFSSDGNQLGTASQDGTFQVYDLESNKLTPFTNIKKSSVYGISFFSYDEKLLLFTGSGDGMVRLWDLWDLGQRKPIHEFRGHQGAIYYLSVSPDGEKLATVSTDCNVRLWNLKGDLQDNLKDEKPFIECKGHQGPTNWISFSPHDRQQLATASGDGTVRLWNLEDKERNEARCIHRFIHPAPVLCVNFIPGKQELVTACWDGKVRLWSLQGKLLGEFLIDRKGVLCVSPSPDGELLATVSDFWNGKAKLLERVEGRFDKRIKDLLERGYDWQLD